MPSWEVALAEAVSAVNQAKTGVSGRFRKSSIILHIAHKAKPGAWTRIVHCSERTTRKSRSSLLAAPARAWPLGVNAQRHQNDALMEVDAVDHHHRQIDVADRARHPVLELALAQRSQAARRRASRARTRRLGQRQRIEGTGVAARRHPSGDRASVVASSGCRSAAQAKLGSDSSPSWRSRARARAIAMRWPPSTRRCASILIRYALRTVDPDPVGFPHYGSSRILSHFESRPLIRPTLRAPSPLARLIVGQSEHRVRHPAPKRLVVHNCRNSSVSSFSTAVITRRSALSCSMRALWRSEFSRAFDTIGPQSRVSGCPR